MSKNCVLYLLHQLVEQDHDDVTRWGCGYSDVPVIHYPCLPASSMQSLTRRDVSWSGQ